MDAPVKVLFVCLGNICRSPTAEGVFTKLVDDAGLSGRIAIDSCGTANYHPGKRPDQRATLAASRRGYDLSRLRARAVTSADFVEFDHILAMDEDNLHDLFARCPAEHQDKVQLFLSFAPQLGEVAVPDPYYGGDEGFEIVLDLIEAAADGLLQHLRKP